jgi:hypothetical protein
MIITSKRKQRVIIMTTTIEINEINITFATHDAKCIMKTLNEFVFMTLNDCINSRDNDNYTLKIEFNDNDDNVDVDDVMIELSCDDYVVFRATCNNV